MGEIRWNGHAPDWYGEEWEGGCPGCRRFRWDAEKRCLHCNPPTSRVVPNLTSEPAKRRTGTAERKLDKQAILYYDWKDKQ